MDATQVASFRVAGSAIAFDRTGARLLLGGVNDRLGQPKIGARLIDSATGAVRMVSEMPGAGPVAFVRTPEGFAKFLKEDREAAAVLIKIANAKREEYDPATTK